MLLLHGDQGDLLAGLALAFALASVAVLLTALVVGRTRRRRRTADEEE